VEIDCGECTLDVTPLLVSEGREWGLPDPGATVSAPLGSTRRLRASWHGRLRLLVGADPVPGGWRLGIAVEALRPLRIDALGVRIRGMSGSRVLVDGFHSWDWAGTRDATVPGRGWWAAMWGDPGDRSRLRVALAAPPTAGALGVEWDGAGTLDAMCRGEPFQAGERTGGARLLGVSLGAGASFAADRVDLTVHPHKGIVAAGLPRLAATPGSRRTGWMSWNCLGAAVTSADVLEARSLVPPGSVLLVDDGWEERWGDWRESARFGMGMPELVAELAASGHDAGLWVAPFDVDPESETVATNPEWLLRGPDGTPVIDDRAPRMMFVLDASRPDVAAALRTLGVRLARSGVRVVKADFLYAGALPGVRPAGWTGVRAVVRGITALADGLRATAAAPIALWACGAPAPVVAGIADACRSGGDAVQRVPALHVVPPAPPAFVHGAAVVRAQTRNLAARSWLWGATLPCDADAVTFGRVGDTPPIDDAVLQPWLEMARRSGGPMLVSDTPDGLDAGRREALRQALAGTAGARAHPTDPLSMSPAPMSDDDFLSWAPDLPVHWEAS
jgi:melibiase-like protein